MEDENKKETEENTSSSTDDKTATGNSFQDKNGHVNPENAARDNPTEEKENAPVPEEEKKKKKKRAALFVLVENYLNTWYIFRRNIITRQTEYKKKGEDEKFKEIDLNSLYRELQLADLPFSLQDLESLLESDFAKKYNPLFNYFESLPRHDGKDYIKELSSCVEADDAEFFYEMLKKHLVRSIACAFDNKVNRFVFVMVSKQQSIGKSELIRWLCPLEEYYCEDSLRDNKDTDISFAQNFFYNLEELASMTNMDINKLKADISRKMIKQRVPYGKKPEIMLRICTFFGSTNKTEFLTDDINTRWLCLRVTSIDYKKYLANIDKRKIWAQVYSLYKQWKEGTYNLELTKEEEEKRDEINQRYEVTYVEKEVIERFLRPGYKNDGESVFRTTTEIIEYLYEKTTVQLEFGRDTWGKLPLKPFYVTKALGKIGYEQERQRIGGIQKRGYWIRKINDEEALNMEDLVKHELRKKTIKEEMKEQKERKKIKKEKDKTEYVPEEGFDFPLPKITQINPESEGEQKKEEPKNPEE